MLDLRQVVQVPVHVRHRLCPRCGSLLAHDERRGVGGSLTALLFLPEYRCTPECGWRGLRFSRSRFRKHKKRLRSVLIVVAFMLASAATVCYVLSRVGPRPEPGGDDGIGEVDPQIR